MLATASIGDTFDILHYMVEKRNPLSRPRRGRPAEHDRDAVVACAVRVFWEKGLSAATLADLERGTGVDRSTVYASFGGKDGLYGLAADSYARQMDADVVSILRDGDAGLDDVIVFLDRVATDTQSGAYPAGCFMLNCLASGAPPPAVSRYLEALAGGLRAALLRAAHADEIPASTVDARAGVLLATVIGYNVTNRSPAHQSLARSMMDNLVALVRSWAGEHRRVG